MIFDSKFKGIGILLIIGFVRAVLVSDFGYGASSFLLILFIFPLLLIWVSSVLVFKNTLKRFESGFWGLTSIAISDIVGIIIYGMTSGWWYVIHDTESQGIFILTFIAQSLIYLIGFSIFLIVLKYNSKSSR